LAGIFDMIFVAIERSITSYVTNNYGKNGSKEHQNVKVIFERLLITKGTIIYVSY
jgi:hypothetical protein